MNLLQLGRVTQTSSSQSHQQDLRFFSSKNHIFGDFQFAGSFICNTPKWIEESENDFDEQSEDEWG